MPNLKAIPFKLVSIVLGSLILLSLGCSENSEAQKLRQYLASINAQETMIPGVPAVPTTAPSSLPSIGVPSTGGGGTTQIIQGTPRLVKDGICGDGIINGPTEDCDQGAIQNTRCEDYNGGSGEVGCQPNCLYDVSHCLPPEIDKAIGGLAETCRCNCAANSCTGGCASTNISSQSVCEFRCTVPCPCNCEGKLEAHIEECVVDCACQTATVGTPLCDCSLSDCRVIASISPNIRTQVSRRSVR
jgi:hypothetical protein